MSTFVALPAAAQLKDFELNTTRELLDLCDVNPGEQYYVPAIHYCIGFFTGAIHYHDAIVGPEMKPLVCDPPTTTREDAIREFVAWGQRNSDNYDDMSKVPLAGVIKALATRWPC